MTGLALLAEYFSAQFAAIAADFTAMVTHPAFFGVVILVVASLLCPIVLAGIGAHFVDLEWLFLPLCLLSFPLFLGLAFHFAYWCGV